MATKSECAPLTYKEHTITVSVSEPIEAKTTPRHLFMPTFHSELLTGTVTNQETKAEEDFALSAAINGSALFFKRGKKWYIVKMTPLLESLMALDNN